MWMGVWGDCVFLVFFCEKVQSQEKAKWAESRWKAHHTSTYTALSSPIFHKSTLISQEPMSTPCSYTAWRGGVQHAATEPFGIIWPKMWRFAPFFLGWFILYYFFIYNVCVCMYIHIHTHTLIECMSLWQKSLNRITAFLWINRMLCESLEACLFIYLSVAFKSLNHFMCNMRFILVWNFHLVLWRLERWRRLAVCRLFNGTARHLSHSLACFLQILEVL